MTERVLGTGGTGKVGRALAEQLRARGVPLRVATCQPRQDDQIALDWSDPATFAPALDGVGPVFLVAPTDRADHLAAMRPFLKQAVADPKRRLVLLSAASLPEGGPMMGEVQAWLRAHAADWVSLRPSWLMQNFTTPHLAGIVEDHSIYSATRDGRVAFINARYIAAVAAEALLGKAPSGELILTGPEALSYDDIAAIITDVSGHRVRHCRLDGQALADRHERHGLPRDYAELLAGMDQEIASGAEDRVTDTVERVTGTPPRRFDDFVAEEQARFTGRTD